MEMYNIKVLIKPEETLQDVIAELCDEGDVGPNEHFCFSAILSPLANSQSSLSPNNDCRELKLNCLLQKAENPYTPTDVAKDLLGRNIIPHTGVVYLQPPLEQWLTVFRPLLLKTVQRVKPRYEKLIPDQDDLLSILYTTVLSLYNKGYYLHNTLIYKSYVNALNRECRKLKHFQNSVSLDAPIGVDDDGKEITLMDQLPDPNSEPDDDAEYWRDKFEQLRARMLQDMSELQFERILIQLATNTVDRSTSYKLDKYRQIFSPSWSPRPNAKGKNKGGKKV